MAKWLESIQQVLGRISIWALIPLLWAGCSPQVADSEGDSTSPVVSALLDETLSANDSPVQAELWRKVSQLSQAEIEEAVAAIAKIEKYDELNCELPSMLFYRWAQHDPVAAHQKVDRMYPRHFAGPYQAVITAWINQGGEREVWAAVQHEEERWDCTQSIRTEVAEMIAVSWNDLSHEEAFKRAVYVKDHNCLIADYLCQHRAVAASKNPESRAAFLAAALEYPDDYDYVISCARGNLFIALADVDPDEAKREIAQLAVSDSEKEKLLQDVDYQLAHGSRAQILTPREAKPWHELKHRLLDQWEASPSVRFDYDLRETTRNILKQAPVEDLEQWAAEPMDPRWIDDGKNAPTQLREFIVEDLPIESYPRVIPKLFAQNDNGAESLAEEAIYRWQESDPISLFDWLEKERPSASSGEPEDYLEDALLELAKKDRKAFDERIKRVDAKLRDRVIKSLD